MHSLNEKIGFLRAKTNLYAMQFWKTLDCSDTLLQHISKLLNYTLVAFGRHWMCLIFSLQFHKMFTTYVVFLNIHWKTVDFWA